MSLLLNPKISFESFPVHPPARYPTNLFPLEDTADEPDIASGKFAEGCQEFCPKFHFSVELKACSRSSVPPTSYMQDVS